MPNQLILKIILENPVPGVALGLQKGKGHNFETAQKQISTGADLVFECAVGIKMEEGKEPVFTGPFAQGPPQNRFIYIGIGAFAGQADSPWSRRLKIPLKDISAEKIKAGTVVAKVAGKGKDGSPSCGTAKPFNGWKAGS